jgi:NitT/TauT family transport system substrate-binding protein
MRSSLARPPVVLAALLLLAGACAPASPPAARPAPAATSAPPAAAVAPAAGPTAAPASPVALGKVRAASQNVAGDIAMYVAADRGYFQQEGLDAELVPFGNASEMNAALATEQVDVAGIGGTAPMWNAVARGVRMKLVLDKGSFRPGYGFTAVVRRKDLYDPSLGERMENLRGRTIAMIPPGLGAGNGPVLYAGLQQAGLTLNDVTVQQLSFPDMIAALANGAIDAGLMGEPFLSRSLAQGSIVRMMGNDEIYPGFTVAALCFTPTFYNNRAAARAFVKAYVRASRDYMAAVTGRTSEADRVQIETTLSSYTRIDPATIRDMVPVSLSLNGLPNQDSLLYGYRFYLDQGIQTEPLSEAALAAVWGLELVEEALNELGRMPES